MYNVRCKYQASPQLYAKDIVYVHPPSTPVSRKGEDIIEINIIPLLQILYVTPMLRPKHLYEPPQFVESSAPPTPTP